MLTTLKPDIEIVNREKKVVEIFELTCPAEHRMGAAHSLKIDKYNHFETENINHKVKVEAFEVGSHTGHLTKDNKTRLASIHKYCKKTIKLKKFINNISAITIFNSYDIPPILPPFSNQ